MKKVLSLIMFFCLAFSAFTIASAETVEEKAKVLFDLGLLKGTQTEFSIESLELDRNATRAEICTTIVRMLGKGWTPELYFEQKAAYDAEKAERRLHGR